MGHKCELCGQLVRVVGDTTLHYEPAPEQLTRPGDGDLIKSLKTTILEQSDQIESLSAECERYRREIEQQALKIERLTWIDYGDGPASVFCRHCSRKKPKHTPGCPAGEE